MGVKGTALAIGVGYVLGARAGEKRYAQLKELWDRSGAFLFESEQARRIGQASKDVVVSRAQDCMASAREGGAQRLASSVRERGRPE